MSIEVLAPAGNEEMLRAAVFSGADAVYLGLDSFNARRSADNFTTENLAKAVSFCHARNVLVYVALNTIVYPHEIAKISEILHSIAQSGADAIIVQDLAVAALSRRSVPALALHASTQLSVHSLGGVMALEELGFKRVVLSRELSFDEIKYIAENSDIEIEVFVHGALCMSMSGQCYMSAFLGGRSGNRGMCAGPCRLPFSAKALNDEHHLSLKDMSHLSFIGALAQIGVASAKIEGRLRTPEYAAAAVNAAVCARDGKEYDAELLQNVFSRSGFTDGYIKGELSGQMFGVRTEDDVAKAKNALPKIHELYRRELSRIPITFSLTLTQSSATLLADDGHNKATYTIECELEPAKNDNAPTINKALSKTGGTPFLANKLVINNEKGFFISATQLGTLRRETLEKLLQMRGQTVPLDYTPQDFDLHKTRFSSTLKTAARFADIEQLNTHEALYDMLILPLAEYKLVPAPIREKVYLELPRALFGNLERAVLRLVNEAKVLGFAGFFAENIAHTQLCLGEKIIGGFGLNISNPLSANEYKNLGLSGITGSCEMTLDDMSYLDNNLTTLVVCYGHMPLMLTRACPIQNIGSCKNCEKQGVLTDRKSMHFPVKCENGARSIYNPVPIYMGDRKSEIFADYALLYFTTESREDVLNITQKFARGEGMSGDFTRGLYYKGTV